MFDKTFNTFDYIIILTCIVFILLGSFIIVYLIKTIRKYNYEAVKLPSKGDKPVVW